MKTNPETCEPALQCCIEGIRREASCVSPRLAHVLESIIRHLFDPDFGIDILVQECSVSAYWLRRHFQTELGCTFHEYVTSQRLVAARALSARGSLAVVPSARRVGLGSYDNLRAACQSLVGQTPSQFLQPGNGRLTDRALAAAPSHSGSQARPKLGSEASALLALETRAFDFLAPRLLSDAPEKLFALALGCYRLEPVQLFRELLHESRDGCRYDRPRGVRLAGLALHVLRAARPRLSADAYRDLQVEGLGWLANAQRLATDCQAADRTLARAELLMEGQPISKVDRAIFFLNKGLLRQFQRRLAEACELLTKGHELAQASNEALLSAQLLIGRGYARELGGCGETAIDDYLAARRHLESVGHGESFLMLSVCSHLANAEALRGNPQAAAHWLQAADRLCDRLGDDQLRRRLRWLEGLLAKAAGRLSRAEHCFRRTREALLAAGETGNAALLSLDLALVCLLRHKLDQAEQLCAEALPMLRELSLGDEAISALRIFEQAVVGQSISREILRQLRTSLETHLDAPTLRG